MSSQTVLYSTFTVNWFAIFCITYVLNMSTCNSLSKFDDPLDVCRRTVHALKTLWTLARLHCLYFY